MFKRVTIVGVGLLGGSLGLAIKKHKLSKEVVGVFRHESSKRDALKAKAVDKAFFTIEEGIKDSELVIICTPVGDIVEIIKKISRHAVGNVIVTDVGSTKNYIVDSLEGSLKSNVHFVGSHPMAGLEKHGVKSAVSSLFEKSVCIVTKTKGTDKKSLKTVIKLWTKIGARCTVLSPYLHDKYVSEISHLPHLVSSVLAQSVAKESLKFAATGFRDTTRIASSDPKMWQDIFLTNKKEVLLSIAKFKRNLSCIEASIKCSDAKKIKNFLGKSKSIRDSIIK